MGVDKLSVLTGNADSFKNDVEGDSESEKRGNKYLLGLQLFSSI